MKKKFQVLHSDLAYSRLFESMMDGYAIVNMKGRILDCNNAFQELVGYSHEELLSLSYQDITPDSWRTFEKSVIIDQVLQQGFSDVYVKEYKHKNGALIPVELRVFLIKDVHNKPECMWAIVRDITDRTKMERSLKESEEKFRSFFENSLVGMAMVKFDGTFEANYAFCNLLGYTHEEIVSNNWQEFFRPDDDTQVSDYEKLMFTGSSPVIKFEKQFIHKSGSIVWTEISTFVQRDKESNPLLLFLNIVDITERRRAAKVLQLSEWKHRIVADNTYDWEFWLDQEEKFIYCSPSCIRVTGHHSSEFLNCPTLLEQIIHPDDRNAYLAHKKCTRLSHDPHALDFRVIHPDGSVHWIGHVCQPIFGEDGNYMGRRGSNRDISMQISINEALKRSEARFRSYFELPVVGFAIISPDKEIIEVNDHLCNLLGYTRQELLNRKWHSLTFIADLGIEKPRIQSVLSGKSDEYTIDKRFIHLNGEKIWANLSVTCVRNQLAKVEYLMAVVIDITERKKAEQELKDLSVKLGLMIKNMLNAFVIWESVFDEQGNYVSFKFGLFNDAYARIAKVNTDDVIGKDVFEVWPDTEQSWVEIYGSVAKTGIPRTFDMFHGSTQGWYHCNAYRPSDSTDHICVIFEDITERKLKIDRIHKRNEELEQKVLRRTSQLQAANAELEAFTYSVSHDLRSPLRAINGFAKILLEEHLSSLNSDAQRTLKIIADSAIQMGRLIDDLLMLSRLNKDEIRFQHIEMNSLVFSVYNEIVSEKDKREISFKSAELPDAFGDPVLVKQVWVNLISNAVKFTSHIKKRKIEIGSNPSQEEIVYFIKDNGAGFNMEYSNKLFQVFQRLHSAKEFEGTGVGLAIIKRIISRLNGHVWAEGQTHQGAIFYFTLPNHVCVTQ